MQEIDNQFIKQELARDYGKNIIGVDSLSLRTLIDLIKSQELKANSKIIDLLESLTDEAINPRGMNRKLN